MSPILIKVIQFFLSLSILIILHELGHFIPAKLFKTRVEKFYLFFDLKFSLFKKKIGETIYGIGWLPLGGYVKISGMIDESMDKEQMALPPKPWEFRSKPVWQRLIIILGGVVVNFILAVAIYIGLAYSYGDSFIRADSLKDGFQITQPEVGKKLGLQNGDNILAVDGKKIVRFKETLLELINGNTMTVKRNDTIFEQPIPIDFINTLIETKEKRSFITRRRLFVFGELPKTSHNKDMDLKENDELSSINGQTAIYLDQAIPILEQNKGKSVMLQIKRNGQAVETIAQVNDKGKLGVMLKDIPLKEYEKRGYFAIERVTYSFWESIPAGWNKGVNTLGSYIKQIKKIFNPDTGAYKGVGGFAAIGNMFPGVWDWPSFWAITAFISIILAFMNILPIPALDGGHAMFLIYEMITGKKPGDKFMEYAQIIGFILLVSLLLYANGNDIYKWLVEK